MESAGEDEGRELCVEGERVDYHAYMFQRHAVRTLAHACTQTFTYSKITVLSPGRSNEYFSLAIFISEAENSQTEKTLSFWITPTAESRNNLAVGITPDNLAVGDGVGVCVSVSHTMYQQCVCLGHSFSSNTIT